MLLLCCVYKLSLQIGHPGLTMCVVTQAPFFQQHMLSFNSISMSHILIILAMIKLFHYYCAFDGDLCPVLTDVSTIIVLEVTAAMV